MNCAFQRKRGRCGLPEPDLLHAVRGTAAYDDLSDAQRLFLVTDFDCHPFTPESEDARAVAEIAALVAKHAECVRAEAGRDSNRGCYTLLTYCTFYDEVAAALQA